MIYRKRDLVWLLIKSLLGLALFGCAPQELAFSYSGSDEGFARAQVSAAAWRDACGVEITVERGGDGIPLEELEVHDLGPSPTGPGITASGATTINGDEVKSIRFVRGERSGETIMHEFGHALGIHYHPDHGIMAHTANRTPADYRVTPADCTILADERRMQE